MLIPAIEDYADIARRLAELKPDPPKVEVVTIEVTEGQQLDWDSMSYGDDCG